MKVKDLTSIKVQQAIPVKKREEFSYLHPPNKSSIKNQLNSYILNEDSYNHI
jgi:hypothetical protein